MTKKKRKPGRPSVPKNKYRGELITVRLQPDERAEFEEAAKSKHLRLSEWIRCALKVAARGDAL
jgi:hypothetical protein